jgi:hypothetical protein
MADGPRYYRVSPKFWSSAERLGWDEETRLLALYLLTCDHRSTEGLFRLPKQYILADLEWSAQRLSKPFARLCSDDFIDYDEDAKVMLIVKALAYQSPSNPNGVTAALRALEMVPVTRLDSRFYELSQRYSERLTEALPERFTQPFAEPPSLALAQSSTQSPSSVPDGTVVDEAFEQFWIDYPRHHDTKALGGGGSKASALQRWRKLKPDWRVEAAAALETYRKVCRPDGQKPKHAERFLVNEAWKAYLPEARNGHRVRTDLCEKCKRSLVDHDLELCGILERAG